MSFRNGRGAFVALLAAAVLVVAWQMAESAEKELSRGTRWVQSHPFTVMGLTIAERGVAIEQYKAAGFTSMLAWKPRDLILGPTSKAGMPWHLHLYVDKHVGDNPHRGGLWGDAKREECRGYVDAYPGGIGWLINDEPSEGHEMEVTAKVLAWLREEWPERLAYSNAFPSGPRNPGYMRAFAETVRPDVLMFDRYPYDKRGRTSGALFWNMGYVRELGLEWGIPYWAFIQSYEDRSRRGSVLPSESQLRMQMYASLAYGYTGIAYFCYDHGEQFVVTLVDLEGRPSRLYASAAKLNGEVAKLGRTLRMLLSTDVFYVAAKDGRQPKGTKTLEAGSEAPMVVDAEALTADAVVGLFKDDDGGRYFMVVNTAHGLEMTAEEGTAEVWFRLKEPSEGLWRMNRETGAVESYASAGEAGTYMVRLPGGTGDLFRMRDGGFAGLQENAGAGE